MEQCGRVSYWRELLDTVLWRTISILLSDDRGKGHLSLWRDQVNGKGQVSVMGTQCA